MQVITRIEPGQLVINEEAMEFFIEVPPGDPNREYGKLLREALKAGYEPMKLDPAGGQPELREDSMRVHLVAFGPWGDL